MGASVRADDVAEAQKAFDTFVQYAKADDDRFPDLFAADVSVTLVFDTGKETRDMVLPPEKFREMVKQGIAKKSSVTDTYEDVKYTPEGQTVKLTCTRTDGRTGKRGAFLLIYGRDAAGHLAIAAMKMTLAVSRLPDL